MTPATYQDGSPPAAEILLGVVAIAGGLAKHFYEYVRKPNGSFHVGLFFAKVFVSGFSGWTLSHTARLLVPEGDFVVVCAAIGGWLGADCLVWVIEVVKRKFGPPLA